MRLAVATRSDHAGTGVQHPLFERKNVLAFVDLFNGNVNRRPFTACYNNATDKNDYKL